MVSDLPESDWKVFRKLRKIALERICDRILAEVTWLVSDPKHTAHARYLTIYELLQKRDGEIAKAFNNPRRSVALAQLAMMMSFDLITPEEQQSFTPRTQSVVEALRQRTRGARAS